MQITISDIFIVIPIILSIIALFQTSKQIKLSNNQLLFQKRIEIYTLLKLLLKGQEEAKVWILMEKEITRTNLIIVGLTNNSKLESICNGWNDDEETPENHKNVLAQIETLKIIGQECQFVFSGTHGMVLKEYFENYAKTIHSVYRFHVIENKNKTGCDEIYQNASDEIKKAYKDLISSSEKIKLDIIEKKYLSLT